MAEPSGVPAPVNPARRRRLIGVGALGVVIVGALIVGFVVTRAGDGTSPSASPTPAAAFRQLTDHRDVTSVGQLGEIAEPETLRRRIRRILDSGGPATPISEEDAAAARACWRRTDPGRRAESALLVGRGTVDAEPVTLLAVTERGRVVTFVVDEGCSVRAAQSI